MKRPHRRYVTRTAARRAPLRDRIADCLGSPLLAAHWLARAILGRGRVILAGHVLLTGVPVPRLRINSDTGGRLA